MLRKHLLKDSLKPGPLQRMLTRTGTLQDAHWPPCINYDTYWDSRRQLICSITHSLHVSFKASKSCLPASKPSVPGQRTHSQEHKRFYFWHKDSKQLRYPETPKRAHWISAQRAHNSSQTLKHKWDHNHTHCDKDPPNRTKSSRRKQMKTADTSHHGESLSHHSTLTDLIQKP